MKSSYTFGLLLALIFVTGFGSAEAQESEVSGTVTDAQTEESMPGVNILVKGTSSGTSTDADGQFSLTVPSLSDTLIFSFVGYETREVAIDGRTDLNVMMQSSTLRSDELVVVGYGSVQRRDLTGSVSSLSSEDFNPGESGSVQSLIQAKMPGVRVVENSGEPGGELSVSIRGAGSIQADTNPLWVVDGSPMPGGLRTFNPDDIESIEVLKDASATAIYGARAAGGVIMVTTKSGQGGPLQVDYHNYTGINYPVSNLDLLSPQEYQSVVNGIIDDGGGNEEDRVEGTGAETDWQEQIFNPGALEQYHSLSFSGGNEDLNYYVSMNLTNEDGIIKNSEFERYGGRINLDYSGNENFEFGSRLKVNYIHDDNAPVRFGLNENAGAVYSAMFFDPTQPVRNEDGTFFESDDLTINNPVAILEGERRTSDRNAFAGSVYGEYSILPSLSVRLNTGFDFMNVRSDTYISRLTQFGRASGGSATINAGFPNQTQNYFIDGTIRYENNFGNHNLNLLGGVETQHFMSSGTFLSAENFSTDATGTDNMGLGDPETYDINSSRASNQLLSAFGRVNYTFNDKYLVTATFRADGSTRFGENNKFGYFPSFAFAWQLGDEPFMDDFDFITELKPRISWGQTGNQGIDNLLSTTTFDPGGMAIWDGQQHVGLSPARLANPNIKWETSEQWDVGVDISLFEDRINASLDYFEKDTYDMLMDMPIPQETGFSSQIQNVGSISNNGFEIDLQSRNISRSNFFWTSNVNFSTVNNEVTDLGEIEEIITGNAGFTSGFFLIREGLPLRSYYGYEVEGVWQTDDDFSQTQENVQPGGSSEMEDYKSYLDKLLNKIWPHTEIIVIGNEPFIESKEGERGDQLIAFYEEIGNHINDYRDNNSRDIPIYVGAFNNLYLDGWRTEAANDLFSFANSNSWIAGVDVHIHHAGIDQINDFLDYTDLRIRDDQRILVSEFSLKDHFRTKMQEQIPEEFAVEYGYDPSIQNYQYLDGALKSNVPRQEWVDFLSSSYWFENRKNYLSNAFERFKSYDTFHIANYALRQSYPFNQDFTANTDPWILNGLFANRTVEVDSETGQHQFNYAWIEDFQAILDESQD